MKYSKILLVIALIIMVVIPVLVITTIIKQMETNASQFSIDILVAQNILDRNEYWYTYVKSEADLKQIKENIKMYNNKMNNMYSWYEEKINEFLDNEYKKAKNQNKIMLIFINKGYYGDRLGYRIMNGKKIHLTKRSGDYMVSYQGWINSIILKEKYSNYTLYYKEM